jgi:hypothetical protein
MARQERTGDRDLSFSQWHRSLADNWHMATFGGGLICANCKKIIAFIEHTIDNRQVDMPWTAGLLRTNFPNTPIYVYFYKVNIDHVCKHPPEGSVIGPHDDCDYIDGGRLWQITPVLDVAVSVSNEEFADFEMQLRRRHMWEYHPDLLLNEPLAV